MNTKKMTPLKRKILMTLPHYKQECFNGKCVCQTDYLAKRLVKITTRHFEQLGFDAALVK